MQLQQLLQQLYEDFDGDCHQFIEYFKREYAGDKLGARDAVTQHSSTNLHELQWP